MLKLNNITVGYNKKPLFEEANIHVKEPQLIALIGRNGMGKSTLLRAIAALQKPLSGEIIIAGERLSKLTPKQRAENISLVTTENIALPHLKVFDTVALGRAPFSSWSGALSQNDRDIAHQALEKVGMISFATKTLDSLSDGERQRVMIARALAQKTNLMLLDEPTAFLDLPSRLQIMRILKLLAQENNSVIILSTHDLELAKEYADTMWVVNQNKITIGTPSDLQVEAQIKNLITIT